MNLEKIIEKDFKKKFPELAEYDYDGFKAWLKKSILSAFHAGLDAAVKAMPKKWGRVDWPFEGERADGWDSCRTQAIESIKALKK